MVQVTRRLIIIIFLLNTIAMVAGYYLYVNDYFTPGIIIVIQSGVSLAANLFIVLILLPKPNNIEQTESENHSSPLSVPVVQPTESLDGGFPLGDEFEGMQIPQGVGKMGSTIDPYVIIRNPNFKEPTSSRRPAPKKMSFDELVTKWLVTSTSKSKLSITLTPKKGQTLKILGKEMDFTGSIDINTGEEEQSIRQQDFNLGLPSASLPEEGLTGALAGFGSDILNDVSTEIPLTVTPGAPSGTPASTSPPRSTLRPTPEAIKETVESGPPAPKEVEDNKGGGP